MSDHEMTVHPWPMRTKYWPEGAYDGIDKGIRYAVRVLHASGIETCQSCQGGDGHAYDHPTVDLLAAQDADGFGAVAALVRHGLPVDQVAQLWRLDQLGRPFETIWRITFKHDFPEHADVTPMFVWGYQAQPRRTSGAESATTKND